MSFASVFRGKKKLVMVILATVEIMPNFFTKKKKNPF